MENRWFRWGLLEKRVDKINERDVLSGVHGIRM